MHVHPSWAHRGGRDASIPRDNNPPSIHSFSKPTLMSPSGPLHQPPRPEASSSRPPAQPTTILGGTECQVSTETLEDVDPAWPVEYLDNACLCFISTPSMLNFYVASQYTRYHQPRVPGTPM